MKYSKLVVNKVIKKSDILVIALSDSRKTIKALPNNRFSINCFYHDDKKPSMILDRKTNKFFCYSCKENGNSIDLLMKIYQIKFLSSLETLADVFGVKLPNRSYTEIDYKVVEELTNIRESEEYTDLKKKSYMKTLKK